MALYADSRVRSLEATILCYADGAVAWPIADRSKILLAGAGVLLDSTQPEFRERLCASVADAISRIEEKIRREDRLTVELRALGLIGSSAVMRAVFNQTTRIAPLSDLPVLLTGETGTGKELLARAIHHLDAKRSRGPFLSLNCAAVSVELAEAELFGHRRGAFTGADRDRPGLFRAAEGGVLFLDEIGDLSPGLQGKLLRALQDRRVLPVGHEHEIRIDVRVIAATNRDLGEMVARGLFRLDLYHRLRVLAIRMPALADRREDIRELVHFLVAKHAPLHRWGTPEASEEFIEALSTVPLPGNVRELENIVREALVYNDTGKPLGLSDLPLEILERLSDCAVEPTAEGESSAAFGAGGTLDALPGGRVQLSDALDAYERQLLLSTLQATGGNRTEAARLLGVSPRSIYNKVRKHGLTP